jgi:hypothetical protein
MVGIRRAISLLLLSLFFWNFVLTAFLGPDDVFACFAGLSIVYGLAFVGVAAEWFWARWFAIGIGNFGSLTLLSLLQAGMEETILVFGVSHLIISLFLGGEGMAARYEHSEATAERWNFQEESLVLMRRAIKSAGMSLPLLILYTLAPAPEAMHLIALAAGATGVYGLLRGRTWGLLAMAGAGLIALADGLGVFGPATVSYLLLTPSGSVILWGPVFALLAGSMLAAPLVYAAPMLRFLRRR